MIAKVQQWGAVTIVSIMGDIDMYTAQSVGDALLERVKLGANNLVIDFSQVTYLSSAGLRILRATARECRIADGDLRLADVPEEVALVLRLSGFDQFLQIFPDTKAALASFKS